MDRSQKERIPTEEEIREILKKTGKMTPEQELNCGACGYPTCREKAIAVFQKKAEVDMCIPYLHDRAQSLSHLVMDTSPNLIMIIDDDMRIQECSVAAEMYFGVKPEAIKGKPFDARHFPAEYRQIFRRSGSHDDHPRSRQDRCRYGEKRITSQYSGNLNEKDQPTVGFFHNFAWKSG